jgi:Phospholipase/Carboxylesterase
MKHIKKIIISVVSILAFWLVLSLVLASQSSSLIFANTVSWSKSSPLTQTQPFFIDGKNKNQIEVTSNINFPSINYKQDLAKTPAIADYEFVIYLHGNAGRLDNIITGLGNSKYKAVVVSPASPGYHESEGSPSVEGVYQNALDMYNYMVDVKGIPENKITILGHSMGGSPATYLASQKPNAKQLVLINTFSSIQSICFSKYSIFCGFVGGIFNSAENAKLVSIPVRQFHLKTDQTVPFEEGQKLYTYFEKSNDKKFVELTKTTHSIIDFDPIFAELKFVPVPQNTQTRVNPDQEQPQPQTKPATNPTPPAPTK